MPLRDRVGGGAPPALGDFVPPYPPLPPFGFAQGRLWANEFRRSAAAILTAALFLAGQVHGSETRATQATSTHASDARVTQKAATQKAHGSESRATPANLAMARKALFEDSQLEVARTQAEATLRQNPFSVEALFIEMETAALTADTETVIRAALRLCELRGSAQQDGRVEIAAARLLDLAGNTEEFRGAIPRIEALLGMSHPIPKVGETRVGQPYQPHAQAHYLRAALMAAAADGAPGIAMQQVAREAGLLTDWRVAGPFGRYPNLDFDRPWAPESDALSEAASEGHAVERVRFADGAFRLPEYFSRNGVLYAAAETSSTSATRWLMRVESPGTLDVFVDGARVLRKDDRFRATPGTAWRALRLRRGTHQVLVKFLPSALPFKVAMLPSSSSHPRFASGQAPEGERVGHPPKLGLSGAPAESAEGAYVEAAQKYWEGDYEGAIAGLRGAQSAAANFLLFQAWNRVSEDAPEVGIMLNAAVKAAPEALAAVYELASRAYAADRTEEALSRLEAVLAARPNFAPGQQLMADIAIRLHWPVEATKALTIRVRLHPSCEAIRQTQRFLASHARYEQAEAMDKALETCAPDTLAYARGLSEAGRHEQASAAAQKVVSAHPLDRGARELLVRELALAGRGRQAAQAARELSALAPNSERYGQWAQAAAQNPDELLDDFRVALEKSPPKPTPGLDGAPTAFYSPYRRDGVQMMRQTAERRFSGGPAVMLVNDRVARLGEDGNVSVYIHKLTRVLDRDGIERYGEVEVPAGAELLELRTIKADGTVVEPEFHQRKTTISMPALAPGDVIEQEYVRRFADRGGILGHQDVFRHTFGSTSAPILYSRFVAITPAGDESPQAAVRGEVTQTSPPKPRPGLDGAPAQVRVWEKNDIAQSIEEVASAKGDLLPTVRLEPVFRGGWREARDRRLNLLIDATRAGARVEEMAARVRSEPPQARARSLYHMVVSSVRSSGAAADDRATAEDTLASHAGSRTLALLAVARAAGLEADLVLARHAGTVRKGRWVEFGAYTHPLVRFLLDDGHGRTNELVADAEADGLAFGALPPQVERRDALLVSFPKQAEAEPTTIAEAEPIIALPGSGASDQSTAAAEVSLDREGNLTAQITIVLGAWRASQMRSILAGLEPGQQPRFFQQLAARIFPGADEVSGETRNEQEPDQGLVITLHCRAPHFANLAQGAADIDQLVPALGLKKMYVGGSTRKFPLYIDTPLFETASFRLHLPPGVGVMRPSDGMEVRNEFGSYALSFRQIAPGELEITRSFHIPVQVIPPERFGEFARFAGKIDDAERQRITVGVGL